MAIDSEHAHVQLPGAPSIAPAMGGVSMRAGPEDAPDARVLIGAKEDSANSPGLRKISQCGSCSPLPIIATPPFSTEKDGPPTHPLRAPIRWIRPLLRLAGIALLLGSSLHCSQTIHEPATTTQPATEMTLGSPVAFDTTVPKSMPARDALERQVRDRDPGLRLIDRLLDKPTAPPVLDREPLPPHTSGTRISPAVPMLADSQPFAEPPPIARKAATISVGIARSTYRTRDKEEVLAAVQPFLDIVQRDVNVRADIVLYDTPEQAYYGLLDGKQQMVLTHVLDYLLVRSWFENNPGNGVVPLSWTQPANPRTTDLDRDAPGPPGAGIELVVAADSSFQKPADLKGARLSMAARYVNGPAAFLASMLSTLGQPPNAPFFSEIHLRRYSKDAVIDVLKGKAEAACVDEGTMGALIRFYGIERQLRTLAVSPHYNFDVLYTSLNNLQTHRTEIELTQRTLTTLGKDPEGQEVLFLFDIREWHDYRDGDFNIARDHFKDFLQFFDHTPADLKPLADPKAPIDRRTYDRYGDE